MRSELAFHGGRPVREGFLVFGSPCLEEPEIEEVVATLRSGWIGTGPKVGRFEEAFRQYIGAKHAVALNSCTAALHLSMLAAGIGRGDEVVTTPMTFCATANAILHCGATPVFVDVDRETQNIDPAQVESAVTSRTKAILPVHFAGRPCDMTRLERIARARGLLLVEDAAHAIESSYRGRKIGTIGDLTCFSFYVTKNLVTGEGGMVATGRAELAAKIQMLGLHGMSHDAWKRHSDAGFRQYEVLFPGYKYNMTDIQASMGLHQLPRLERYRTRRVEIWRRYDEAFADLPCHTPAPAETDTTHARHLYTLLLDVDALGRDRDRVQQELQAENIGTGIHFMSLHLHRYYRETFGFRPEQYPNAQWISERTISLPLSASLADRDVEDVIAAVRKVLSVPGP